MKRSELKALIKECVVEVLHDGLGKNFNTQLAEGTSRRRKKNSQKRSHPLDNVTYGQAPDTPEIVVDTGLSQDPVLESIFQDTASTTLQEQVHSERRGQPIAPAGSDRAAMIAAENEPDELFEGASNWAKLAFDA